MLIYMIHKLQFMMNLKTSEILMINSLIILIKKEKHLSLDLKPIFYNIQMMKIKDFINIKNLT